MTANLSPTIRCSTVLLLFCIIGYINADVPIKKSSSSLKSTLITINDEDWDQMLTGEWMVEFHAPWCPACRALQPEWKSFSSWSSDLSIKVGAVDVTTNPGLSGRFIVTALPTIFHVKDGIFRHYKGTRDTNAFVSFIEEKKWQSIEPVSSWYSPNSVPMSIVSYFFKISMTLRSIHNNLVEDYGIPYWGSYILFAFATILLGAILGLIIVCVIDLIFTGKASDEDFKKLQAKGKKGSDENLASGDLEDDMENDSKSETEKEKSEGSEMFNSQSETEDEQSKKTSVRRRRARHE